MSFISGRRDLLLVVGARTVSLFGDLVATIALVLRLQSHGAGPAAVAALLIANLLPIVLLSGLVGRLVDARDNRTLLVVSGLVQAAVCVPLAAAGSLALTLALVAALGVGQAVNGATWQALLPALVPADGLSRAVSFSQAATTLAGIVAPAAGGLLVGLLRTVDAPARGRRLVPRDHGRGPARAHPAGRCRAGRDPGRAAGWRSCAATRCCGPRSPSWGCSSCSARR